jgi:hypothetical protein
MVLARGRFRVSWTWLMVNQQGYTDGFRIEIESKTRTHVFDLIAVVSSIEVREAQKKEANQSLQPTPVARSLSEKSIVFERQPRRG